MSVLPFSDPGIFPAIAAVFEQMLDDEREADDAFAHAQAALAEAETVITKNERDIDEAVARLRVMATQGLADEVDLDHAIENALVAERTMASEAAASLRLGDRISKLLKRHSPRHHALMVPLLARVEALSRRNLEHMRDVRWTLMALKGQTERGKEGSILTSAGAVSAYLDSLT